MFRSLLRCLAFAAFAYIGLSAPAVDAAPRTDWRLVEDLTVEDATWRRSGSNWVLDNDPTGPNFGRVDPVNGGGGSFEDYGRELWERPVKDNSWNDSGTPSASDGNPNASTILDPNNVRTLTEGEYWSYGDLQQGSVSRDVGIGADAMNEFLYISWTVAGQEKCTPDCSQDGLLGQYYYYFEMNGAGELGYMVNLGGGTVKDIGSNWDDRDNVFLARELSEGDDGQGVLFTDPLGDSEPGYQDRQGINAFTRVIGDTLEVAILLEDLGATNFDIANVEYSILGVAVSNPSSVSDEFAHHNFDWEIGSGVEYDTLLAEIPLPSSVVLMLTGLFGLGLVRHLTNNPITTDPDERSDSDLA